PDAVDRDFARSLDGIGRRETSGDDGGREVEFARRPTVADIEGDVRGGVHPRRHAGCVGRVRVRGENPIDLDDNPVDTAQGSLRRQQAREGGGGEPGIRGQDEVVGRLDLLVAVAGRGRLRRGGHSAVRVAGVEDEGGRLTTGLELLAAKRQPLPARWRGAPYDGSPVRGEHEMSPNNRLEGATLRPGERSSERVARLATGVPGWCNRKGAKPSVFWGIGLCTRTPGAAVPIRAFDPSCLPLPVRQRTE